MFFGCWKFVGISEKWKRDFSNKDGGRLSGVGFYFNKNREIF